MRIGLLTSGGDAPGMNAAIRAVVRTGTAQGHEMFGIYRGYNGLIEGDIRPLDNRAVSGIIERGGTILRSARSQAFLTDEGQEQAVRSIADHRLDAVIVAGGNGSLRGARCLHERGIRTIGIPASIDNDVSHTAMAIGVDTALNTVVDSLNRIRDTAVSHERAFVIEVMGRSSGYIALMGGLAGGAELVLMPEKPESLVEIVREVKTGIETGKRHSILCVAEGFQPTEGVPKGVSAGKAIAAHLEADAGIETRLTVLGHLQRGGSPSAFDRILACRLGHAAVTWCGEGRTGEMAGLVGQEIVPIPFERLEDPCTNVDRAIHGLAQAVAN